MCVSVCVYVCEIDTVYLNVNCACCRQEIRYRNAFFIIIILGKSSSRVHLFLLLYSFLSSSFFPPYLFQSIFIHSFTLSLFISYIYRRKNAVILTVQTYSERHRSQNIPQGRQQPKGSKLQDGVKSSYSSKSVVVSIRSTVRTFSHDEIS